MDKPAFISSNDEYTPHVTAQWRGETLMSLTVTRVSGEEITKEDLELAWAMVPELKAKRRECGQ